MITEVDAAGVVLARCAPGAAHSEDRDLRRVDDRGERADAEHAEIRDREGAVMQIVGLQRSPPRSVGEPPRVRGDLDERLPVGIEHDGHEQRVVRGNGDADVDA